MVGLFVHLLSQGPRPRFEVSRRPKQAAGAIWRGPVGCGILLQARKAEAFYNASRLCALAHEQTLGSRVLKNKGYDESSAKSDHDAAQKKAWVRALLFDATQKSRDKK